MARVLSLYKDDDGKEYRVGDKIIYHIGSGIPVKIAGIEYVIVDLDKILAKIENDKEEN